MIKLGERPPIPESLKSKQVEDTKKLIESKIKSGTPLKSSDFKSHLWRKKDIKNSLKALQHGKCCYCERMRNTDGGEIDVDHFRPKAGIAEEENHPGYWWLAYEWKNLFLACKSCNELMKKNQFPLLPGGKRSFAPENDLEMEKPVLIHPIEEDPGKFVGFDFEEGRLVQVKAVGLDKDGRGFKTVNGLTAVNKEEVMVQRAQLVKLLKQIVEMVNIAESYNNHDLKNEYCSEIIREETAADREFTGLRRVFFRAAGLGEYVSKD
jgi:uncharacterized protein (TIGR02646 family)